MQKENYNILKKQLKKTVKENRKLKNELTISLRENKNFFKKIIKKFFAFFHTRKNTIKPFRKHFSNRFRIAVEQRNLGFLTDDDLELIIENEQSISMTIENIKKIKEQEQKKKLYYALLKKDKPLLAQLKEEAKNELIILQEHLLTIQKTNYYDPQDIKSKDMQIKKLNSRIENINKIIEQLKKVDEVPPEEKRPVGRPKKQKYDDLSNNLKTD